MDCRVLGMGINNSVNILCSTGIGYAYNLRFLYSATAVIIFLVCLFTICMTSRSYHQKRILSSYAGSDEDYITGKNVNIRYLPETERRLPLQEMQVNAHPYVTK